MREAANEGLATAIADVQQATPTDGGALAREALACKGWEWVPGMRMVEASAGRLPCRVVTSFEGVRVGPSSHRLYRPSVDAVPTWTDWLPDLDDATTVVGGLLALVRKAYRDPCAHVVPCAELRTDGTSPIWFVYTGRGKGPIATGPTEASALVAALKAAP